MKSPLAHVSSSVGLGVIVALIATLPAFSAQQPTPDPNAPADFTVTDTVLRPREKVPPLAANNWGGCGAVERFR